MNVVLLGASGQIGSLIYHGLDPMHRVVGTSRGLSPGHIQFDPFKDDWSVLGKPDVLINCIGQINATSRSSFYHIHVGLTKRMLAHREQIGFPRIIQISALGASSNHEVEFLKTKGIADDLLLQHPDTAVIRPSIVCTRRTMLAKKMLLLSNISRYLFGCVAVPNGFLETRVQPIMPQDLVDLVARVCIDSNIRMIDAVGPKAISFREIIETLSKCRNKEIRVIEISKRPVDFVVKTIITPLFPEVINSQQYQLIFRDNTGNVELCEKWLGRGLMSTNEFFKQEFT